MWDSSLSAIEDAKEAVITKELGQELTSNKGQAEEELEESEYTCSPLTLLGVQPAKPGEINTMPRYGVKSVPAQSGDAVTLAEFLKESDRELYTFLMFCIYVNDLANSNSTIRSCIDLAKRADELFTTVGLEC